jgi:two-component system, NtrC family, nitrogen regulation sensor histidine kinase NtrY
MASRPEPPVQRQRLSLGSTRRRLKYEHRIRLWLTALTLPMIIGAALLAYQQSRSFLVSIAAAASVAIACAIACAYFFEQLIRPLQTLSNVVAALREDDFSFRARGASRGDSLGDLALEINAHASTLQSQRSAARDALTLVERVMTSMQSPVLAFDAAGHLRLMNPAAQQAFHLQHQRSIGMSAQQLQLETLLATGDEGLYADANPLAELSSANVRWSVRRTTFRLQGVPHTLFVLSDVAAALREEERLAWHRLIRVLSHEINNSLTPIKSIAGSLRTRLPTPPNPAANDDMYRGLTVIEERAASLNRFLQAYQQLMRLPAPRAQLLWLGSLLEQVTRLETRLPVALHPGPPIQLFADPDQLQQLLINLIRNAVEAALSSTTGAPPEVSVTWSTTPTSAVVQIRDNGMGLMNPANLFVPFYTTKPEGSGIGLVLAQQIATVHKGSVTLYNNPDTAGCIAELRLPLEPLQ